MPDVLRNATLKIRTPSITILNRWQDPGDSGQKYTLNLEVEKIEVNLAGFKKPGSTLNLGTISKDPMAPDVVGRTVTITDPVNGNTCTLTTAGIATALEAWIAAVLDETYPTV